MFEYTYENNQAQLPEGTEVSPKLQTELTKPKHLISLASSGLLVSIDVSIWSATKQDRVISNEITTAKNAVNSAGRYTKNLLADHPKHKALTNYRQTIYNWLKRRTYDWSGSQQYLPVADLVNFKAEYNVHDETFNRLKDELLNDYDSIVSDMAFKQGDMFNRDDYPTKDQVAAKCRLNLYINNVPENDFRCQIAGDLADDLFKTYSRQTESIINCIVQDQMTRFATVMESLSHCCGYDELGVDDNTGETKTKKRKIYDSTVQKAKEMCDSFKQFNLTDNPDLENARAMLEKTLDGVSAEDIRDSDAIRNQVKSGVDDILNKFGAFKCIE